MSKMELTFCFNFLVWTCVYAGIFLGYVFNFSFNVLPLGVYREEKDFQEFQEWLAHLGKK